MIGLYGGALAAAFAGSPHCVGMCGPLAVAASDQPGPSAAYHAGRLTTYAVLGGVAGALGHSLPGPSWVGSMLAALLLVGFSASLAGWLPEPKLKIPGLGRAGALLAKRSGVAAKLAFGMVNGLLPCGLVYAALAVPIAMAHPLHGAAAMALFGLGTVPALVVASVGLRRVLDRSLWRRRALAVLVLVSGLASLGYREGLFHEATAAEVNSEVPPCHR